MLLLITLVAFTMLGEGMIFGWYLCVNFAPRSTTVHFARSSKRAKLSAVSQVRQTGAAAVEAPRMGLEQTAAPAIESKPRKPIKFADWQTEKLQAAADAQKALAADANMEVEYDVASALQNEGYTEVQSRRAAHAAFLKSDGSFDATFRLAMNEMPSRTVVIERLAS